MNRRQVLPMFGLPFLLAGCGLLGRHEIYRWKLSLSLDTPDGVKSAYNVVEERVSSVSIPAQGISSKTTGEALYIEIGPGKRPLVALLSKRMPENVSTSGLPLRRWQEGGPGAVLALLNGEKPPLDSIIDLVARFKNMRGARAIITGDLPHLVTFDNPNDPMSVIYVDPDDLGATFGPGVKWRSMTLEVTDEPLTSGLEKKLPWVVASNAVFYPVMPNGFKVLVNRLAFKKKGN